MNIFLYLLLAISIIGFLCYKSIQIYIRMMYEFFKYKYDNKLEAIKLDRRILAVPYRYQHHEYYALLPISPHKPTIINIYSKNPDIIMNVTKDISKYLGHNNNFSGCRITPSVFGYPNLIFDVMSIKGDVKTYTFNQSDNISIPVE